MIPECANKSLQIISQHELKHQIIWDDLHDFIFLQYYDKQQFQWNITENF